MRTDDGEIIFFCPFFLSEVERGVTDDGLEMLDTMRTRKGIIGHPTTTSRILSWIYSGFFSPVLLFERTDVWGSHHVVTLVMDGKMFLSPIDPKRILDLGTGTGMLFAITPPSLALKEWC
jgi:hypothetical protein